MGILTWLLVVTTVAISHAGRLPYLGGDIDEFVQSSKQVDLTDPAQAWIVRNQEPVVQKPITRKQKRDSTNYNTKFTDIARAYAEGYKAAIKAVQQRAIIAKRRLQNFKPYAAAAAAAAAFRRNPVVPRSLIPGPPAFALTNPLAQVPTVTKSTIPAPPAPELIPGIQQSKEVISPSPVDEHETHTLPTLNDFPDNKAAKEEMVSRSTIPTPAPAAVGEGSNPEKKSVIASPNALNQFAAPAATKFTENAVEKSWIPTPAATPADTPLDVTERSTKFEVPKIMQEDHPAFPKIPVHLRSEEDRSKIAKLNARARHRNIYFDGSGGDPFNGGGVLSRQNAISVDKKHRRRRRRRSSESDVEYYFHPRHHGHFRRYRRSHMPYLGQNLDALGVVRAQPKSWTSAQVRKSLELKKPSFSAPSVAYIHPDISPSPFSQAMPPSFRGSIPQPPMAMMSPPLSLGGYGQIPQFQTPQFPGYRSMIPGSVPGYPSFYGQMPSPFSFPFQSPLPAGVINEDSPNVESSTGKTEELREKKSTVPMPESEGEHQAFETVTFST